MDDYADKYNIDKYKYRYQPWDGNVLEWILGRVKALNENAPDYDEISQEEQEVTHRYTSVNEVVRFFKNKSGLEDVPADARYVVDEPKELVEHINDFNEAMSYFFLQSKLPCMLAYLYLKIEQPIKTADTQTPAPLLQYLLELPYDQAQREFFIHYYCHKY